MIEDCISRKAVNVLIDELARAISDERCCISRGRDTATIMQDILDLPSVTPLPKHHGRLIDADALLKKHQDIDAYPFPSITIQNAPTIIEADKGDDK